MNKEDFCFQKLYMVNIDKIIYSVSLTFDVKI
jgi:hypothetical protein